MWNEGRHEIRRAYCLDRYKVFNLLHNNRSKSFDYQAIVVRKMVVSFRVSTGRL